MRKTHVAILLDRSGSMGGLRKEVVAAVNRNFQLVRDAAKGQNVTVSLFTFGGSGTSGAFGSSVRDEIFRADVKTLPEFEVSDYRPDGGTPLYDAVGHAITKFEEMPDHADREVSYLIQVITDGLENESKKWYSTALAQKIREAQASDRWTFTFQVPNGGSYRQNLLQILPLQPGNVIEWNQTAQGVSEVTQRTVDGTEHYFQARAAGARSVKGFYETSAVGLTATKVKKELDDISAKAKVWTVERECDIRSFFQAKTGADYQLGTCFYQLTKQEEIAYNKRILLMKKGEKAVYDDARSTLGVPEGLNIKVKPGNHADWDIFVQSMSTNRKLVRGTRVIWIKK